MSITWILVANASAAYLYVNYGPKKGLQKLKEFRHDASRETGSTWFPTAPDTIEAKAMAAGPIYPPPIQDNTKFEALPAG